MNNEKEEAPERIWITPTRVGSWSIAIHEEGSTLASVKYVRADLLPPPQIPDKQVAEMPSRCKKCGHDAFNGRYCEADDPAFQTRSVPCGRKCVFPTTGASLLSAREKWLLHDVSSAGRLTIQTEQYDELRALAQRLATTGAPDVTAAIKEHSKHVSVFLSEMAEIWSLDVELGDDMKVADVSAALLRVGRETRERLQTTDECLMADCRETQAHFCVGHVLSVHTDAGEQRQPIDVSVQHDFIQIKGSDRCGLRGCALGVLEHAWIPPWPVPTEEKCVRCGGDFESTGGKPNDGSGICQKCRCDDVYAPATVPEGEAQKEDSNAK